MTLREAFEAKLTAARQEMANAEAKVHSIEQEIASIPEHLHALTWDELKAKVESWFA